MSMPTEIIEKGYEVHATVKRVDKEALVKISKRFVVKEAAEIFCKLALTDFPDAYVKTIYGRERSKANIA